MRWAPPYYGSDEHQALGTRSALYLSLNRGKRSIRLDLKSDAGREALLRLAGEYDVVLEASAPASSTGSDAATRRCAPPTRGSSTARSPATARRAQHAARRTRHELPGPHGAAGDDGRADGRPIQSAGQIADLGGGAMMAAFGVLAALRERERSGEGQLVDVSMTDGALAWLAMVAAAYLCDGRVPRRGRRPAQRGLPLLLPLRGVGRLGHLRSAGAEVLARLLRGRRAPGPDRDAVRIPPAPTPGARSRTFSVPAPATSGAPSTTSTTR